MTRITQNDSKWPKIVKTDQNWPKKDQDKYGQYEIHKHEFLYKIDQNYRIIEL